MRWLSLCAILSSGCSFMLVKGPPSVSDPPTPEPQRCTTSVAAPVVDAAIAGFQAVRTGLAIVADDSAYYSSPISRQADMVLGVGLTTLFATAAGYGFATTAACSEYKSQWAPAPAPLPTRDRRSGSEAPRSPSTRPQAPPGPACDYDAECDAPQICEQGHCTSYWGQK